MRTARAVFPLDRWFRQGVANFYAERRFAGSGPSAIAAHREALADDPWSAGLRRNLAGFMVEAGDMEGARVEVEAVARITPRSQIVLRVNLNTETR
jgi:hypothetical protein